MSNSVEVIVKVGGGHHYVLREHGWFLADDSDTVMARKSWSQVDQGKPIEWDGDHFLIPLHGNKHTIAHAGEALWAADHLDMMIRCGRLRYVVTNAD